MPFSKLFALLVLAGVIPIIAGALFDAALYAFIIYNVLLLILLIADRIITPGPEQLEVERVCDELFSLYTENEVAIMVRNNSGHRLEMKLRDSIPPFFGVLAPTVDLRAAPHAFSEGRYCIVPQKRGQFTFGDIHCRYSGILRLCTKKAVFRTGTAYKVYPSLKDLRKYGLSALNRNQLLYGVKKSKSYSLGTEFESLREYSEGDDYRKINWMATARSNKLIVNAYEPERNQQVFILLDSSRVMNSEINYVKKLDYAINSAFLLADVATGKGDNTGLLVFDSEVRRFIKPGKGSSQFRLIADNLYNVGENMVSADYRGALAYLAGQQKRRSLLCIFTELFNRDEALELTNALKSIAPNHLPLVITIKDMRLYEAAQREIRESMDIFTKSAAMKLVDEREKVQKVFHQSGIPCLDVPPDKLSIEVVNRYITMKSTLRV